MRLDLFYNTPELWFCPNNKNTFMLVSKTGSRRKRISIYYPSCGFRYA